MVCFPTTGAFDDFEHSGQHPLTAYQLTITIKKDLKLTQTDISNSNIIALVATYVDPIAFTPIFANITLVSLSVS